MQQVDDGDNLRVEVNVELVGSEHGYQGDEHLPGGLQVLLNGVCQREEQDDEVVYAGFDEVGQLLNLDDILQGRVVLQLDTSNVQSVVVVLVLLHHQLQVLNFRESLLVAASIRVQHLQRGPEGPFKLIGRVQPAQVHVIVDIGLPEGQVQQGKGRGEEGRHWEQRDDCVDHEQDDYVQNHGGM